MVSRATGASWRLASLGPRPAPTAWFENPGREPSLPQSPVSRKRLYLNLLAGRPAAETALGSDWGRSRGAHLAGIALALAWAACGSNAVSPADASPVTRTVQAAPATPLDGTPANLTGSTWMGLAAVEVDSELWAELRMSAGAVKASTSNGFSADGAVVNHLAFRFSVVEAADIARELRAWVEQPHSVTVYSVSGGDVGAALTGNAWDPALQPVVVVQVFCWIPLERGQVHGGQYMALNRRWANALASALDAWAARPAATSALLFQRSVQ